MHCSDGHILTFVANVQPQRDDANRSKEDVDGQQRNNVNDHRVFVECHIGQDLASLRSLAPGPGVARNDIHRVPKRPADAAVAVLDWGNVLEPFEIHGCGVGVQEETSEYEEGYDDDNSKDLGDLRVPGNAADHVAEPDRGVGDQDEKQVQRNEDTGIAAKTDHKVDRNEEEHGEEELEEEFTDVLGEIPHPRVVQAAVVFAGHDGEFHRDGGKFRRRVAEKLGDHDEKHGPRKRLDARLVLLQLEIDEAHNERDKQRLAHPSLESE